MLKDKIFKNLNIIRIAVGLIWVVDGVLQLNPSFFTAAFIHNEIQPASVGSPALLRSLVHVLSSLFLINPGLFNGIIAAVQIVIGLAIIVKASSKWGLASSIVWGSFVWLVGESAGGLFMPGNSLFMGFPGAALLYVVIAAALLYYYSSRKDAAFNILVVAWLVIWIAGMFYQLTPGASTRSIQHISHSNIALAPEWLKPLDKSSAVFLSAIDKRQPVKSVTSMSMNGASMSMAQSSVSSSGSAYAMVLILAIADLVIAISVLLKGWPRRAGIILGMLFSLLFWSILQNFGGIFTGPATDPNSGILLFILGLSLLLFGDYNKHLKKMLAKLRNIVV